MTTVYTTNKTSTTSVIPARSNVAETAVWETFALTAALAANNIIQMVKVPKGATILDVLLTCTDLDTASAPAIHLSVGDGDDADRFILADDYGQTAEELVARLNNPVGHCYTYTADDTIDVKVETAPTTGATTGTVRLSVLYTMEQ